MRGVLTALERAWHKAFRSPFWTFDVETLDWNRFRCAVAVSDKGDVRRFTSQGALSDFVRALRCRVMAHFGGRFDFFFLPRPSRVVPSGSGILRAQLGQAALYDSWYQFQMPLKAVGEAVGLEKWEGKSDSIESLTLEETLAHCENDTRILQLAELQCREWCSTFDHPSPRWPPTSGSTAVYVAEVLERAGVAAMGGQLTSLESWFQEHAVTTGGRVERLTHGLVSGDVYCYDLNSSYPYSWLEAPIPLGPWRPVQREVRGRAGVYWCSVRQSRDTFPVLAPGAAWRYDGECWATTEEITAAREAGGAVEPRYGFACETAPERFGASFVESLYAQKLEGSPWAKLSVNAFHGKFEQGLLQTAYTFLADGTRLEERELLFPAWFQRPIVGAWVYARARVRLWRVMDALRRAGWRVHYCDTDSVHTDCPPDRFPGRLGKACGEWKLEHRCCSAVYVAPKVYGLELAELDTGVPFSVSKPLDKRGRPKPWRKLTCKGFPREDVTWELLLRAAAGERTSVTSRRGLKAFLSHGADGWGPHVRTTPRTLCTLPGEGKRVLPGGEVTYDDA